MHAAPVTAVEPLSRVRYEPHARQAAVHDAREAEVWACCGYGVGKTTLAVWEAFSLATQTHPGFAGIVAAPTFPLLFQSWFTEWERNVPRAAWRMSRDPMFGVYIEVPTPAGPSRIWMRSTVNASGLEGINAAWLVFDEATRERDVEPSRVLAARIRRGHPGRVRRKLIIGPPQTRGHWTSQAYGTGPDATRLGDQLSWTDGERRVVRARTRDNPHLPAGFEEGMRTRPGASRAWCKQWLDAEFGAVEGQVYEAFSRDVHVVRATALAGRQWADVIVAVDWGWTHPGVALVLATDGRDHYVVHEEVHRGKVVADTPDGWVPLLRDLCGRYGARRVFCDPSQPGHIETTGRGLRGTARTYPAQNDVGEGIRRVTALLEWGADRARTGTVTLGRSALYVSDACPRTVGEFEGYSRRKGRDGAFTEDVQKIDDDAMDALRYGVMELQRD
jgi:hypothetical protein